MKENVYHKIRPSDVYLTILDGEKLRGGEAPETNGVLIRPSGNNFIDHFARLIHQHGDLTAVHYAAMMGVKPGYFQPAISAMTGMGAREWICGYLQLAACELLEKSDWPITQISKRLGFPSISAFSQFFRRMQNCQPYEWRARAKHQRKTTYHYP